MELKIKKEYLNKYISCKGQEVFLSSNLTQDEMKHIQLCLTPHVFEEVSLANQEVLFVKQEVKEEKEFKPKSSHKTCKGSKELGTNCGKCEKCLNEVK